MDPLFLVDYFNNPHDTENINVKFVKLWMTSQIQGFVETNMDETNYKLFNAMFYGPNDQEPIMRFNRDDWLNDDEWIYNSIIIDYRKLTEMSNRNVRTLAGFFRMKYFDKYLYHNDMSIPDKIQAFNHVFCSQQITGPFKQRKTSI